MIESQESHVHPLGVCKELVDAHRGVPGQKQQEPQDQKARHKADGRGQEDHQHHFSPEVVPGDGAGAESRDAGSHYAADEGVGGGSGDAEAPGGQVP